MKTARVALLVWAFALRAWYGSAGLDRDRFWDERYSLENVASILTTGSLQPVNGWYPGLSHLPYAALLAGLDALHRATGDPRLAVFRGRDFGPAAYLVCRLVQALLGTATILLTCRLGRRLFSPGVGLAGGFLLAVVPTHLRLSAYYKPDVLLLCCALLALDLALSAAAAPGLRRFLAAGAAVGLALASKLTGGAAAVPVAIAGLAAARHDRRALLWLAAAGAVAAAVFLALDPWPGIVLGALSENAEIYGRRGALAGQTRLSVLGEEVAALLSSAFHGPLVGTLALGGAVALLVSLVWRGPVGLPGRGWQAAGRTRSRVPGGRPDQEPPWRLGHWMLLAYGVAFSLLYALGAGYAKANNFLQVTPVTSLLAAWVLVEGWRRVAAARLRPVAAAAGLALAAWLAWGATATAYEGVVPSTRQVAGERLAASLPPPLDARFVVHEGTEPLAIRGWTRRPWRRVAVAARPVGRLHEVPEEALDLADAEVFPERELAGVAAELYRRRMAAAGAREVIAGEPFRRRGESLVLLAHPWQPAGEPAGARLRRAGAELRGTLPAGLAAGEVASLEVWLPEPLPATAPEAPEITGEPAAGEPPTLSVGGEAVPLIATRSRGGAVRWLSARFRVGEPGGPVALALPAGREAPAEAELTARRWWR